MACRFLVICAWQNEHLSKRIMAIMERIRGSAGAVGCQHHFLQMEASALNFVVRLVEGFPFIVF